MKEAYKLEEAKYFLGRMRSTEGEPVAFRYELSAFLSAARSILQYAYEEAKKTPQAQTWYRFQVGSRPVIKFLKDKRDISVHQEPVIPSTSVTIKVPAIIHVSDRISTRLTTNDRTVLGESQRGSSLDDPSAKTPSSATDPPSTAYRHRFLEWSSPEDVITLCSTYLAEIESVVKDGGSKGFLQNP